MAINCCYGCVAPKRHPGCHDNCPDRIEEKALNDEKKAVENKNKAISAGITAQKVAGIVRANRRNKPKQSGWKRGR